MGSEGDFLLKRSPCWRCDVGDSDLVGCLRKTRRRDELDLSRARAMFA
jgi:hypothetical protein